MLHHFAYPNILAREDKFVGCGRYAALLPREVPETGYERAVPNSPNKSTVRTIAEMLAPESFDSEREIYEAKDEHDAKYQGDSLDLAYLLVLVSRSRKLRWPDSKKDGDIWCTGSLDIRKDTPQLVRVDGKGFDIKLRAFLSEKNRDNLFIIPTANIRMEKHASLLEEKGVQVLSLRQFPSLKKRNVFEKKTILKVLGNEVELLADVLFEKPASESFDRRYFGKLALGLLLTFALLAGVLHFVPRLPPSDPPKVTSERVREKLTALAEGREADFFQLWTNKREFGIGDFISLHFQSDKDCYLVLINMTSGGDLIQLFPNTHSQNQRVRAKKKHTISGDHSDLKLKVTGPSGKEEILALISESPFEIIPIEWSLLEGTKDDQVLLNDIYENIQNAMTRNLTQKRISYSVVDKTN